ncbi:MAG TPA: type 1 glutamine amidotransferase [Solirubrobacteraceae bacterium]|nr:type 1 glutamine amidotransferase [Solirubrobacteraceae bacterium]
MSGAVAGGMPVWGVCLGAQLLAASLGATVAPGPAPEVGVLAVQPTAAAASDPVFSVLPDEFRALQWHGDTFALPAGAVQLARSGAYEQQAFVVNRRVQHPVSYRGRRRARRRVGRGPCLRRQPRGDHGCRRAAPPD